MNGLRSATVLLSIVLLFRADLAHPQGALPDAPVVGSDATALKIKADLLFKRILLKPNDLDAAFQYAEVETALGDLEAAIGSLERMLFYNPNLSRVKLELGILYFRLGSYAMAKSYLDSAVAGPNIPPDVRERVVAFDSEIDRRLSTHQFSFFAQTGLRGQSNANAGPNSLNVRALGEQATLSTQFRRQADVNAFVLGTAQFIYDFENQRGDVWETNATGYYAAQFKVAHLNLGLGEIDTGPRLAIGTGTGLSFRPYVLGEEISLGDAQYLGDGGGGVSFRYQSPNGYVVDVGAEGRARAFSNSTPYPNAHDQRGDQVIVPLTLSGPAMFDGLRWQGRLSYVHNEAFATYFSYDQFGIELSLPYEFPGLFLANGHSWTVAPFGSFFDVAYATPQALVDPNLKRHDRLFQGGATLDMRFRDDFGFAITAQYVATQSNLPNFRTSDFIVSAGPTFRY